MDSINLGEADGLPPVDWATVVKKLESESAPAPGAVNSRTTWLCTVNPDGSPHVTAVGAVWLDDTFWFQMGSVRGRGATSRVILGVRSPSRPPVRTSSSRVTLRG
jgi:hypothetical protein